MADIRHASELTLCKVKTADSSVLFCLCVFPVSQAVANITLRAEGLMYKLITKGNVLKCTTDKGGNAG